MTLTSNIPKPILAIPAIGRSNVDPEVLDPNKGTVYLLELQEGFCFVMGVRREKKTEGDLLFFRFIGTDRSGQPESVVVSSVISIHVLITKQMWPCNPEVLRLCETFLDLIIAWRDSIAAIAPSSAEVVQLVSAESTRATPTVPGATPFRQLLFAVFCHKPGLDIRYEDIYAQGPWNSADGAFNKGRVRCVIKDLGRDLEKADMGSIQIIPGYGARYIAPASSGAQVGQAA